MFRRKFLTGKFISVAKFFPAWETFYPSKLRHASQRRSFEKDVPARDIFLRGREGHGHMDVQQVNGTPKISRKLRTDARLAYHDAMLNVEQLSALLLVSAAWIRGLAHEGVLHKVGSRFRLIDAVQAYLRYQRDEQRRTGKQAVTNRVIEARAKEIEITTAQRERQLMPTEQCIEIVDTMVGMFLSGLSELPAQCSRDFKVRATVEKATRDLRQKIADRAKARVRELSG
jgi:hypothetical protein